MHPGIHACAQVLPHIHTRMCPCAQAAGHTLGILGDAHRHIHTPVSMCRHAPVCTHACTHMCAAWAVLGDNGWAVKPLSWSHSDPPFLTCTAQIPGTELLQLCSLTMGDPWSPRKAARPGPRLRCHSQMRSSYPGAGQGLVAPQGPSSPASSSPRPSITLCLEIGCEG